MKDTESHYLEMAKRLSREEAERLFSRMRGKLLRRLDDRKLLPLDAIARQLKLEDEELNEWRAKLAEIRERHKE